MEKEFKGKCECEIESIIKVDERGQMVLPKEIRKKLDLDDESKLAVVSMNDEGGTCCISLIKTEELREMVKEKIEPLFNNI